MSLYFRSASGRVPVRSQASMRAATSLALAAYPLGALCMLIGPADQPTPASVLADMVGLGLIVVAFLAFAIVAPSYLQRIAAEQACALDELEKDLRRRAYAFSYQAMTGIALVAIFYLAVANDETRIQLWAPSSYAHWNTIFWGVMLYAFTLPTAYLAWTMPAPLFEDEEPGAVPTGPRARASRHVWRRRIWLALLGAAGLAGGIALAFALG